MLIRIFLVCWVVYSLPACGHTFSTSDLKLDWQAQALTGQWEMNIIDLDAVLGLDQNVDGLLTWGELQAQQEKITTYLLPRLQIKLGGEFCKITNLQPQVNQHSNGMYYTLWLRLDCDNWQSSQLNLDYSLFFDLDANHQLFLTLKTYSQTISHILSAEHATWQIDVSQYKPINILRHFLAQGIMHVLTGYDHVLFLVTLLLPAVLVWKHQQWQKRSSIKSVGWSLAKVVTAFTVAHSITLTLATLQYIQLPSYWVESGIALSIIIVACNNLYPFVSKRHWLMAFGFGLIHGMGFASVLLDLGLIKAALFMTLFGFNLGVEIGQLLIVMLVVPLIYGLSRWQGYRYFMQGGSMVIIVISGVWLVERLQHH